MFLSCICVVPLSTLNEQITCKDADGTCDCIKATLYHNKQDPPSTSPVSAASPDGKKNKRKKLEKMGKVCH